MKLFELRSTLSWLVITFAVCILVGSCNKPDRVQLTPGVVIHFDLPYKVNIGNLKLAEKGAGFFFYSFTTKTHKRIDLFDQQGKLLKTLSLKNLLSNEKDIDDIVFRKNRFLLLSEKTNNLYTLDTNGAVVNIQHFDAPYENSLRREIRASNFNGFMLSDNKYLFNCYYYFADTVLYQSYYDHINHYPYFMEVNVSDSSQPTVSYRLPGFYTRFMPRYGMPLEAAVYSINEQNILLSSWYTDSIYVVSKTGMQVTKAVPISSDYTKLGVEPLIVSDTLAIPEDELNARLQTQGLIANITYDSYRNYYYVTVFHNSTREQRKKNGPWSFIVLDSVFTRLGEVKMDEKKYDTETLLVTEAGLLFKLQNNQPNEFQLYQISVR